MVKMTNVLNIMSLMPRGHRIIKTRKKQQQQQSRIWRLISMLKISDILHLNKANSDLCLNEISAEITYTVVYSEGGPWCPISIYLMLTYVAKRK